MEIKFYYSGQKNNGKTFDGFASKEGKKIGIKRSITKEGYIFYIKKLYSVDNDWRKGWTKIENWRKLFTSDYEEFMNELQEKLESQFLYSEQEALLMRGFFKTSRERNEIEEERIKLNEWFQEQVKLWESQGNPLKGKYKISIDFER